MEALIVGKNETQTGMVGCTMETLVDKNETQTGMVGCTMETLVDKNETQTGMVGCAMETLVDKNETQTGMVGCAMETLVDKNAELENDALSDWQPMYVAQYMTDGIELSGADNQAGGGVLDSLQPLH